MNNKLIALALGTLIIAPALALVASRTVDNLIPAKNAPSAAPAAADAQASAPSAYPPKPVADASPPSQGNMPVAGMPNPEAGQPMLDLAPPAPPPPPQASNPNAPAIGAAQGYAGEIPAVSGTARMPDGTIIG